MQKFFDTKQTNKVFREIAKDLKGEQLSKFYSEIQKAFMDKQVSKDDSLLTYKITSEELEEIYKKCKSSNN